MVAGKPIVCRDCNENFGSLPPPWICSDHERRIEHEALHAQDLVRLADEEHQLTDGPAGLDGQVAGLGSLQGEGELRDVSEIEDLPDGLADRAGHALAALVGTIERGEVAVSGHVVAVEGDMNPSSTPESHPWFHCGAS